MVGGALLHRDGWRHARFRSRASYIKAVRGTAGQGWFFASRLWAWCCTTTGRVGGKIVLDIPLGPPCVWDFGFLAIRLQWPRFSGLAAIICSLFVLNLEMIAIWLAVSQDPHRFERREPLDDHVANVVLKWSWLSFYSPSVGPQFLFVVLNAWVGFAQKKYDPGDWWGHYFWRFLLIRLLRISMFLCTTLPSPHPGCYLDRFQHEEQDRGWWHMALVRDNKYNGGCNDLLFSGHCAMSGSVVVFIWMHAPGFKLTKAVLVLAYVLDALLRIQQRMHYSVDIWLSTVIVVLVFYATDSPMKPMRMPASHSSKQRHDDDDDDDDDDSSSEDVEGQQYKSSTMVTNNQQSLAHRMQSFGDRRLVLWEAPPNGRGSNNSQVLLLPNVICIASALFLTTWSLVYKWFEAR